VRSLIRAGLLLLLLLLLQLQLQLDSWLKLLSRAQRPEHHAQPAQQECRALKTFWVGGQYIQPLSLLLTALLAALLAVLLAVLLAPPTRGHMMLEAHQKGFGFEHLCCC
jgi:hypothetical protein